MTDPLSSWNECASKRAILDFVARVTDESDPDHVPVEDRIAVFDNDGTLWPEQPVPSQIFYALDAAKRKAARDPSIAGEDPFRQLLAGDLPGVAEQGMDALRKIMRLSHTGMTTVEFDTDVRGWLANATHPKLGRPILKTVYQPMLEVLRFLRSSGFRTFIVSGGTADFMRVFAEDVYGIPPEQVIGTTFRTQYESRNGAPVLVIQPELAFYDDKDVKPSAIHHFIGHQPLMAFGNSDGDYEMLEWTTKGPGGGPRFGMFVHHTDAEREFRYDRDHVPSGTLVRGLDDAERNGWVLTDMKDDWKTVFGD